MPLNYMPRTVFRGRAMYVTITTLVLLSARHTLAAPGECIPLGSAECVCDPGGYGPVGGPCELCPENHYCPGGAGGIVDACPENSGTLGFKPGVQGMNGLALVTEASLQYAYGPDVVVPYEYACPEGSCLSLIYKYFWASTLHLFRSGTETSVHGMIHTPLQYYDSEDKDFSYYYRPFTVDGSVSNAWASKTLFIQSSMACANLDFRPILSYCEISLPPPNLYDYSTNAYTIDVETYKDAQYPTLYRVPGSSRVIAEKGVFTFVAESVLYSTMYDTSDPAGTFYGYVRVNLLMRILPYGEYDMKVLQFELPLTEDMQLVDLDVSILGDVVYLTTTKAFYSFSVADNTLQYLYGVDFGQTIEQAHLSRDATTIYMVVFNGATRTLLAYRPDPYDYKVIKSNLPADMRICQFPTLDDYAFTTDGKLYRYNFASGTTIRLMGTDRPSSPDLDKISAPIDAYVSDYNLIYGADHHCSVLNAEFTHILLKDRETIREFVQGAEKPAVSAAGSSTVTDCQCSADSFGVIESELSTCSACPLHERAASGSATEESCSCYDNYQYTSESPDTCVACSPTEGCVDAVQTPAEVKIKFRIALSPDGVEAKKTLIRQAAANRLALPLTDITIYSVRLIRMGSGSGMRRLLQDSWESEITMGIAVAGGTTSSETDAALTEMTTTIQATSTVLMADIAASTGATATYQGSSCEQLTIPAGYWPSPTECGLVDINECELSSPCHESATCTNTEGSYLCECPIGTYGDGVSCNGNAPAVRITVEVNVTESTFRENYAAQFTQIYSAVLLTQTTTSTDESTKQAAHAIVAYSESPSQTLYVDIDVLFASPETQHAAWQAFDNLLFLTAVRNVLPASYSLSVAFGVRKLTLQGQSMDSVQSQASQGLSVLAVEYDPSCPPTGCWKITAQYTSSDPHTITAVYVPRVQTDAEGFYTPAFINTYIPSAFPCRSDDPPPTMCCVPAFLDAYRPLETLQTELLDSTFQNAIDTCDASDPSAAPNPDGLLTNHNYMLGHLQGMPYSRVEYMRLVNPDTDTHEIQIIFDEDELRSSMSIFSGSVQTEYTLKTFIGMSFATPMGTSVFLDVKNQQVSLTVRRTNYFTVSASGPVDFTNIDYSSAVLHRTKVNYGFETIYLQHAEITIQFKDGIVPDMATGPFPLQGIRVGKGSTLQTVQFVQACSSTNGTGIYENAQTQAKFAASKAQSSCAPQVDMCVQPTKFVGNTLKLYVPLGENFWTDADVNDPNIGVYVDVMVNLRDAPTNAIARSTFRAYAPVVAAGIFEHCESVTSSIDLTSVLSVDLVVGTELTANPNDPMPAGTYFTGVEQTPGSDNTVPTDKINISASTVQGAMLSVVVRGDPEFFDLTSRYFLEMNDVISMHFLESTPTTFNQISALVANGGAFTVEVSTSTGNAYLAPSAALLSLCSFNNMPNYFDCFLRRDVQNGVATFADRAYEHSTQGETAAGQFMASVFESDGTFAQDLGKEFWRNVTTRFSINDRYNRAWSINPSHAWSLSAVQNAGFSRATLQTNLLMFALVTLRDSQAPQAAVGRRLLQVGTSPTPAADMSVSRAVQNNAVDNVAQKCAALGIALDRCAVLVTRLQMPFKNSYCDVFQNTDAYAAYYADLKSAVASTFTTKYVQGQQGMHVLPYDIRGTLDAACSASSISRRLLQSTLTAAAEIAYEVTSDGKLVIDMVSLQQSGKVLSVRRLNSTSLVVEVTDTALGTVVTTPTATVPTSTTTTETSSSGSNNTVLIVVGIVAAVAILYYCSMDHEDKNDRRL